MLSPQLLGYGTYAIYRVASHIIPDNDVQYLVYQGGIDDIISSAKSNTWTVNANIDSTSFGAYLTTEEKRVGSTGERFVRVKSTGSASMLALSEAVVHVFYTKPGIFCTCLHAYPGA